MARKHYGKPFDEYKTPSNSPKPSKPSKPSKPTANKVKAKPSKPTKAAKPTKKPTRKPSPYSLGTGSLQKTGSKIKSHQKRTKDRIDKMFKQR